MTDLLTWSSDLDNFSDDFSDATKMVKSTMFQLHKAILATGVWVVAGSCDSTQCNMTGIDYIGTTWDASKWVQGGGTHTWIVYYCSGLGHYMCLDWLDGNAGYGANIHFAKTAFTGGTTSARPTSPDSWYYQSGVGGNQVKWNDGSTVRRSVNLVYSTRGDFWWWVYKNGVALEEVACGFTRLTDLDPDIGDNYPCVSYCSGTDQTGVRGALNAGFLLGDTCGSSNYNGVGKPWKGRTGGGVSADASGAINIRAFSLSDSATQTFAPAVPVLNYWPSGSGQWRHKYLSKPIDLYVVDTNSNYTDYKGLLPDVELGPRLSPGSPNGSTVTRRSIGNLWLPGMPTVGPG